MEPMGAWVEVLSAFGRTAAVGLPTSKMADAPELLVSYRPLANYSSQSSLIAQALKAWDGRGVSQTGGGE